MGLESDWLAPDADADAGNAAATRPPAPFKTRRLLTLTVVLLVARDCATDAIGSTRRAQPSGCAVISTRGLKPPLYGPNLAGAGAPLYYGMRGLKPPRYGLR